MNLQELKSKKNEDLVQLAESLGVENAASKRSQELIFEILQKITKIEFI